MSAYCISSSLLPPFTERPILAFIWSTAQPPAALRRLLSSEAFYSTRWNGINNTVYAHRVYLSPRVQHDACMPWIRKHKLESSERVGKAYAKYPSVWSWSALHNGMARLGEILGISFYSRHMLACVYKSRLLFKTEMSHVFGEYSPLLLHGEP